MSISDAMSMIIDFFKSRFEMGEVCSVAPDLWPSVSVPSDSIPDGITFDDIVDALSADPVPVDNPIFFQIVNRRPENKVQVKIAGVATERCNMLVKILRPVEDHHGEVSFTFQSGLPHLVSFIPLCAIAAFKRFTATSRCWKTEGAGLSLEFTRRPGVQMLRSVVTLPMLGDSEEMAASGAIVPMVADGAIVPCPVGEAVVPAPGGGGGGGQLVPVNAVGREAVQMLIEAEACVE